MRGISGALRTAGLVFIVLIMFWTPKVYTKVADKNVVWTETLICRIWQNAPAKFTTYTVPGGMVLVPTEEMSNFRALAINQHMEPKPGNMKVSVTERGYVLAGWNWSLLAGYALFSLAIGALVLRRPPGVD